MKHPVIIAGAGPGGLTTALALHAQGIPIQLFEAVATLKPLGVGINLGSIWIARIYYPNRRCHLWCSNLYSAPDPCNP
jgi:ribulose 1,5-bisphosphate synthetase/thiazole synthase